MDAINPLQKILPFPGFAETRAPFTGGTSTDANHPIPALWCELRNKNKRLFSLQQALHRQLIIHLLSMHNVFVVSGVMWMSD
jgi:hypothetical protein